MNQFDIVLVNFPFTNLKQTKLRPALVASNITGENNILCQITTKDRNIKNYEIILPRESCEGKIFFDSRIYVDTMFTLHNSLIKRKIGKINNFDIKKAVKNKVFELFE